MKAQYRKTKDDELILVYVNYNKIGVKRYECYLIYDDAHFEADKEYLLTCKPQKRGDYVSLTSILARVYDNLEIINRLPKL